MEMDFLKTAEEAARIAGNVLESWAKKFTVSEKGPSDLVTEADVASQKAIYDLIHSRYPDHNFLGEETLEPAADDASAGDSSVLGSPGTISSAGADSEYRWVVDPLDGTSNYVHRFPYYAVSIALEHHGELLAGVVYDPNRDEMFSALRGGGAFLNGAAIQPSKVDRLDRTMAVASLPVAARARDRAVKRFLEVMPYVQTVQRTGSAALNLAYVAAGRIDTFWSTNLKPWDMAAGALLVTEAGGKVTQLNGERFDISVPDLLATNGSEIHARLQKILT